MKYFVTILVFILINIVKINAQTSEIINPTPAAARMDGLGQRQKLQNNSVVNNVPFRSVGPTIMGGRVVDLDVDETDPTHFLAAYASGGLWKTENNGTTFKSIFDHELAMTIGDIAVNWKQNIIWIGTGENNSSRSSYSGVGVYKSSDGGKSWQHKGLEETQHIGRIILHPADTNTLWVAALGHLYSHNSERGIYKTSDGGKNWKKTLFVSDSCGAIDLIIDPLNSNILYASSWQRERSAWNFSGAGIETGIWKSTDGGENWALITTSDSGFPTGNGTGRIGLQRVVIDGKTIICAVHDNQNHRPKDTKDKKIDNLDKNEFRKITKEDFLKLEKNKIISFLKVNNFPKKYTADTIFELVKLDKIKPSALADYLEDANAQLFDTEVIGAEIWRSLDDGASWKKCNEQFLDDTYYSYGYYFAQIRISSQNPKKIYISAVPLLKSSDGGKTFINTNSENIHGDHHALWINPKNEKHLINGSDGGINISYDEGESWLRCNSPPTGQFYAVNVDNAEPYNIYGGLQDNGVWKGPSTYSPSLGWQSIGKYPYQFLSGGDGMQVQIDPKDNQIIYTGSQFGYYSRINLKDGTRKNIMPKHNLGERPLRFNWQTPILLSSHNSNILYFGANKLFRSFNQGDDWESISEDLTKGGKKGNIPFGTVTTISESEKKFGLIYVGTDDGNLAVTKDGGNNWNFIQNNLPKNLWATRIQASTHELGRVYCALNAYRNDNFKPYLYYSENFGETWKAIGTNLPMEPINVVKEDPKNSDILYVGTDNGLYISVDKGENFMAMNNNLPAVAVHDLVIHRKASDIIVGTHGRSVYVASVAEIQKLNPEILNSDLYLFDIQLVSFDENWGNSDYSWEIAKDPIIKFPIFCKENGIVELKIKTEKGMILQTFQKIVTKGINYVEYNLTFSPEKLKKYEDYLSSSNTEKEKKINFSKSKSGNYFIQKGKYEVFMTKANTTLSKKFLVE